MIEAGDLSGKPGSARWSLHPSMTDDDLYFLWMSGRLFLTEINGKRIPTRINTPMNLLIIKTMEEKFFY